MGVCAFFQEHESFIGFFCNVFVHIAFEEMVASEMQSKYYL